MLSEIICLSVSEELREKNIIIYEIQNLNLNWRLEQLVQVWREV